MDSNAPHLDAASNRALIAAAERASAFQSERTGTRLLFRVVQSRPEVASIVSNAFMDLRKGDVDWTEMPSGHKDNQSWNMLWTWSKPKIRWEDLLTWQRVNHFQEAKQLTRKDNLKRNISRFRNIPGKIGEAFDILPVTYTLPGDYVGFCTEFAKRYEFSPERNFWIMKPAGSSRGRGIFVFNDIGAVSYTECVIVQRYIERPLLLDGYKFDLRLYVLVTSIQPLEAFIYKEGFARLSSEPYSTDQGDITNKFIHLTNSSIQKHNVNHVQAQSVKAGGGGGGGSKVSLSYLRKRLAETNIAWSDMWQRIVAVVLKTLYCVQDTIPPHPNSFELFGFDVLIDADLKPWLIEVNASPSLSRDNELDFRIKDAMIRDTLRIAAPPPFDRDLLANIFKKRLQEKVKGRWHTDKSLPASIYNVLGGNAPRELGEMPKELGEYQRIAPSPLWDEVLKIRNEKKTVHR